MKMTMSRKQKTEPTVIRSESNNSSDLLESKLFFCLIQAAEYCAQAVFLQASSCTITFSKGGKRT